MKAAARALLIQPALLGSLAFFAAVLFQPAAAVEKTHTKEDLINQTFLAAHGRAAEGKADLIWVRKSEYMLHLIIDQQIMASYPIALGKNPIGHKQKRDDSRTPEGLYFIDYRNEDSRYFLSLHISYPDERDQRQAHRRRLDPGSDIVIHGEPNEADKRRLLSEADNKKNWTDGCIALSNAAMVVLWQSVAEGTPILIEP